MRKQRRELTDGQFALAIGIPVILLLVAIVFYPFAYSLWLSLQKIVMFGGYRATFVGLDNYFDVLTDKSFWWSSWVTARFVGETVVLTIALGLGMALILNRRLPVGGLVRTIFLLPWCVSLYSAGVMFAYLARGQTGVATAIAAALGIDGTLDLMRRETVVEVLAVGSAWTLAPLVGFFILSNLKTIPRRLYDLAAVDQFTAWETFRFVTLPPLRFSLFVFTCITAILAAKIFDFIFVLSGGGPGNASATLVYEIYKVSFKENDLGRGAAISFILLAMMIATTLTLYALWGRREKPL
jgi:multiple sugar transport system permease protein